MSSSFCATRQMTESIVAHGCGEKPVRMRKDTHVENVHYIGYMNSIRSLRAEYSINFTRRLICVSSFFALATHPAVIRR